MLSTRTSAPSETGAHFDAADRELQVKWLRRLKLGWLRARGDIPGLCRERDTQGLNQLLQFKKNFVPSIFDSRSLEVAEKYAKVRSAAAGGLGAIGDAVAADFLVSALSDVEIVREAAANALGQIGDGRAVGPLLALLEKERADRVMNAARDALVRIGQPAVLPLIKQTLGRTEQYAGASGTLVRLGAAAVQPLVNELGNPDSAVREHVAGILAEIQDKRAIPGLSKALEDQSHDVRSSVVAALRSLGCSPTTDVERASYAAAEEKWDACLEMGALAVEPLIIALKSERDHVREGAAETLGRIGDRRATGPLIEALQPFQSERDGSTEYSPGTEKIVIAALQEIGDERAVGPLAEVTQDEWTAVEAVAAIRSILAKRLATVDEDGLRAVAGLGKIKQAYTVDGDYVVPVGGERAVDCADIRDIAVRELARRAGSGPE